MNSICPWKYLVEVLFILTNLVFIFPNCVLFSDIDNSSELWFKATISMAEMPNQVSSLWCWKTSVSISFFWREASQQYSLKILWNVSLIEKKNQESLQEIWLTSFPKKKSSMIRSLEHRTLRNVDLLFAIDIIWFA